MGLTVLVNLIKQITLVFMYTVPDHLFDVLILVGTGFDMGGINKNGTGVEKPALDGFLENASENLFKKVAFLKTSHVILAKGRKVGNLLLQPISQKPAVSDLYLYLFYSLPHGTDTKECLQYQQFD